MKNLQKHIKGISAGLLFAAGICTIIWGTNIKVQFGLGCLCWCVAVVIVVFMCKQRNQNECKDFEHSSKEILLDIAPTELDFTVIFPICVVEFVEEAGTVNSISILP